MIKFAPKKQKHLYIAKKKEKKIFVYRYLLTLPGHFFFKEISANV